MTPPSLSTSMCVAVKCPYPFCSRHTLLLSGGQVVCRGEEALEEYLRRTQEVAP